MIYSDTSYESFQKVETAAAYLEAYEREYSLEDLVRKADLSVQVVLQVLKEHWIEADRLDIVYLDLKPEEEKGMNHLIAL